MENNIFDHFQLKEKIEINQKFYGRNLNEKRNQKDKGLNCIKKT